MKRIQICCQNVAVLAGKHFHPSITVHNFFCKLCKLIEYKITMLYENECRIDLIAYF